MEFGMGILKNIQNLEQPTRVKQENVFSGGIGVGPHFSDEIFKDLGVESMLNPVDTLDMPEFNNLDCKRAKLDSVLHRSSSAKAMVPPRQSSSSYTSILKPCFPQISAFCARNPPVFTHKENRLGQEMSGEKRKLLQEIVRAEENHAFKSKLDGNAFKNIGENDSTHVLKGKTQSKTLNSGIKSISQEQHRLSQDIFKAEENLAFKCKMEVNAFKIIGEKNTHVMREQIQSKTLNMSVEEHIVKDEDKHAFKSKMEGNASKNIGENSTDVMRQQIQSKTPNSGNSQTVFRHGNWDGGGWEEMAGKAITISSIDGSDAAATRNKVKETLNIFRTACRELQGKKITRVDLQAAKMLKKAGKYLNTGKKIIGQVQGIEVGDKFHYRMELAIIGLHRLLQSGIDYVKEHNESIATSIVASREHADYKDDSEFLVYVGQGGDEDQKLERGNLALYNSMNGKNPVRVIWKERKLTKFLTAARTKIEQVYTYDGLYSVQKCWRDEGPQGILVYKFLLKRIPGQPAVREHRRILGQAKCLKRV